MFGVACQRRANVEACKFARLLTLLAALALCLLGLADFGYAQQQQQPPSPAVQKISILLARELHPEQPPPLSLLDQPNPDDGVAGAKLGVMDNNTTGKFMGQEFALDVVETAKADELVAEVTKRVNAGSGLIIVDADPKTTLAIADAVKGKDALVINYGSPDDSLREENCRSNMKHTPPTRTMLADALAQYLVWKKWYKWFLVKGPQPEDELFAAAIRRSAKKFGAKIVEERAYTYSPGSRRSDGGYEQVQQQIPTFTQGAPAHDIVMVADEGGLFGDYLPYRTWDARPVAGTSGLIATSWHPALELWGGTQFQNRFKRLTNRQHAPDRLHRLDGRARDRRGGDTDQVGGCKDAHHLHGQARVRTRRLQGHQDHIPRLEWAVAATDPGRHSETAGKRLAAAGLSASG